MFTYLNANSLFVYKSFFLLLVSGLMISSRSFYLVLHLPHALVTCLAVKIPFGS